MKRDDDGDSRICIGLFEASVSKNETIEICITFQVPLIFHLDVGFFCLMAIPLAQLSPAVLKYSRKRILEKSIKL